MNEFGEKSESVLIPAPEVDEERFRQRMKSLREFRKWSQGELSRRLIESGWPIFHQTTISRIEAGDRPVKLGEARAIAAILGESLDEMIVPPEKSEMLQTFRSALNWVEREWSETSEHAGRLLYHQQQLRVFMDRFGSSEYLTDQDRSVAERWLARLTPEHAITEARRQRKEQLANPAPAWEGYEDFEDDPGNLQGLSMQHARWTDDGLEYYGE